MIGRIGLAQALKEERVGEAVAELIQWREKYIDRAISACESPIERLLFASFFRAFPTVYMPIAEPLRSRMAKRMPSGKVAFGGFPLFEFRDDGMDLRTCDDDGRSVPNCTCGYSYLRDYALFPQHQIALGDTTYRVDFAIVSTERWQPWAHRCHRLVIEADGHAFHERTKEQARHDKQRDRALQRVGWEVIRFTGSEIWNNPARCIHEIQSAMWQFGAANALDAREEMGTPEDEMPERPSACASVAR